MEENERYELQLGSEEKVIKRYDFITPNSSREDALIFTDSRAIRRVANPDYVSQQEILLSDVNRISSTCKTSRYATEAKNDPKKFIFIGVGILLAIIAIILLVKVARGVGVIMLLVGVGLVIGGLCIQKKVGSREETILKVAFFERISDKCVISIEKKMEDKGEAMTFANEIGIILTKITPHRSDLKQADD